MVKDGRIAMKKHKKVVCSHCNGVLTESFGEWDINGGLLMAALNKNGLKIINCSKKHTIKNSGLPTFPDDYACFYKNKLLKRGVQLKPIRVDATLPFGL